MNPLIASLGIILLYNTYLLHSLWASDEFASIIMLFSLPGFPRAHRLGLKLVRKWTGQISARLDQMILSFFALLVYGLHSTGVDLGTVAMTHPAGTNHSFPTFNFTIAQKGVLISSVGYGYTVGNVLFGLLADAYGPMTISPIAGGLCTGVLYIIYPSVCLYGGFAYACGLRAMHGFLMSCIYPCVYVHMSKWIVPQEQSKFSWIWTGHPVGSLMISMAAGPLAESSIGWAGIFFLIGCMALVWALLAFLWGADSPSQHRTIDAEEKMFIEKHLPNPSKAGKFKRTPWLAMLKSVPLWTFVVVQTFDWFATDMVYPFEGTYLTGVFSLSVQEAGSAVAFANVVHIPVSVLFTYCATKWEESNKITIHASRKFWNTIGTGGEGLIFFILALSPKDYTSSILLFTTGYALSAATHMGYMTNVLDFAPNYTGTIAGTFTALSSVASSFGSVTTGLLVHNERDADSWRMVFVICALVLFSGNLIFVLFGSTKLEPWNNIDDEEFDAEKLLD